MKNTCHVDLKIHNLDNVRFFEVTSYAVLREYLTAKYYVVEAISNNVDESSLLRLDPDEKRKLDEKDSLFPNFFLTSPKTILENPT